MGDLPRTRLSDQGNGGLATTGALAARFVIMRLSDVAERFGESAISAEGGLAPHPAAFRCVATGGPDRLPG